jgi:Flp pilus assembly protein TadD
LLKPEPVTVAIAQLREAVPLDPHVAEMRNLLRAALARRGDLPASSPSLKRP